MWGSTQKDSKEIKIFVQSNGMHSNLVLPLQNSEYNWLTKLDNSFSKKYKEYVYIALGWGDIGFYIGSKTKVSAFQAVNAIFLPSKTLIQTKFYAQIPQTNQKRVAVWMSKTEYQALCQFIEKQFIQKGNKQFALLEQGYRKHDYFFDAKGSYHLFNTCNNWTSRGLKKAGIQNGLWTPFDWGVFWYLN